MMSGQIPSPVKGMSTPRRMMPMTPFWPWCEENLSPISGVRVAVSLTRTSLTPSLFVET